MEASSAAGLPPRVVFYDGVCGFCDTWVQWLLTVDRNARLHFAPLQGATAAALRRQHPEIPPHLDSIVYVETSDGDQHVYWCSEAVFRVCADVGVQPRLVRAFQWLPRWCADLAYRLFARVRYRVFGKLDTCRVPSAEVRQRFLP